MEDKRRADTKGRREREGRGDEAAWVKGGGGRREKLDLEKR